MQDRNRKAENGLHSAGQTVLYRSLRCSRAMLTRASARDGEADDGEVDNGAAQRRAGRRGARNAKGLMMRV